jgi:hypothetical protein
MNCLPAKTFIIILIEQTNKASETFTKKLRKGFKKSPMFINQIKLQDSKDLVKSTY